MMTHFLEDHLHNYIISIAQIPGDRLEFRILKLSKKSETESPRKIQTGASNERLLISPMHS
jgi:hypothetical protein